MDYKYSDNHHTFFKLFANLLKTESLNVYWIQFVQINRDIHDSFKGFNLHESYLPA